MSSETMWNNQRDSSVTGATTSQPENENQGAARSKLQALRELSAQLLREVQSISEVGALNVSAGLDFYAEVSRFEIELIKRALLQTGGHQGRAARLLNLKVTTLNSKIKHYRIPVEHFSSDHVFSDTPDLHAAQPA